MEAESAGVVGVAGDGVASAESQAWILFGPACSSSLPEAGGESRLRLRVVAWSMASPSWRWISAQRESGWSSPEAASEAVASAYERVPDGGVKRLGEVSVSVFAEGSGTIPSGSLVSSTRMGGGGVSGNL